MKISSGVKLPRRGTAIMPDNEAKPGYARAVTLFYCINAVKRSIFAKLEDVGEFEINPVKIPCSSMIKETFILKALEAGAEAVLIITCPEDSCQFIDGNRRANKRVERVRQMLDEIGYGGWRVSIHNSRIENEDEICLLFRQALGKGENSFTAESLLAGE
jgi:coenzyme F420-reducing hydrogenase delta subunit